MKRLMFVRHGESEWNQARRLQGQADIDLSTRGAAQAEALRGTIEGLAPDRVITSNLQRARRTTALLGFPSAEERKELREIDVGEWTGASIETLMARDADAYRAWRAGAHTPPGGETWHDFACRVGDFARAIVAGPNERILLVSHGGVLRALLQELLGLPPERIVPVGPGSLSVLRHARRNGADEVRLEVFNFSPGGPQLDSPD
jgi:probable phosphoglycerate mutase